MLTTNPEVFLRKFSDKISTCQI